MAELNTVARPYTKAAFEYALEQNSLDQWSTMIKTAASVAADPVMVHVLSNPALTSEQKAKAMITVCGDQLDTAGKNFMSLLADNRRMALLPEICLQFEKLKAAQEKSIDIDITTAFELNDKQQKKLTQALTKKLGRDVHLSTQIDKSILGGLIVRTDDLVIDGSIRARLAKLAEAMNS